MKFGSVCSGIEAASVAWGPLGWKAAWLSEIEPFPSAVLAHHYPDVPNLGDMTLLPERILSGEVEAPDLFCGGTPCQAFSVAGLRNSLDDARGNLSLVFCEIANAIDKVRSVRGLDQSIIFWENVPGVLSTKDNAFGCFLGALAGEDEALVPSGGRWTNAGFIDGPQRAVAWRVLDAQYFGVAQRRRRVFVVASARADFNPAKILFEFNGVRRDTAPSREAGKESASGARTGASVSSGHGYWLDAGDRAATLRAQDSITKADTIITTTRNERVEAEAMVVSRSHWDGDYPHPTLNQSNKGSGGVGSSNQEIFSQRGAYLAPAKKWPADIASTLDTTFGTKQGLEDQHVNAGCPLFVLAQPINIYGGNKRPDRPEGGFYVRTDEDTSKTLDAATGLNPTCSQGGTAVMQPISIQDVRPVEKAQNGKGWNDDGTAYTVDTHATQGVAAFKYTMGAKAHGIGYAEEQAPTLDTRPESNAIFSPAMQVRRLTPVECERLQGFPDGYTNIPWRKKDESPDGPRYKALGNSWAVPVVRWIGERIAKAT